MFTNTFRAIRNRGMFISCGNTGGYVRTIYKGDTPVLYKMDVDYYASNLGLKAQSRYTSGTLLGDSTGGSLCFVFGSGTTEATLEDYTLEEPFTENNSSIAHVYTECTYTYENNLVNYVVKTAISATSAPLVIKEFGLVSNLSMKDRNSMVQNYEGAFYTQNTSNKAFALYYREALPEEQWITINAGETREFIFTMSNIDAGFQT